MADLASELDPHYARYYNAANRPRLARTLVLLLDTLGTKDATIAGAERNLQVVHHALRHAEQWTEGADQSTTLARWFSDNLVMADPVGDAVGEAPPLGFALVSASWVQLELASMGLFTRGGMDLGDFFANEQFVYGPALVKAHKLETTQAIYPRIVLSADLAKHALDQLRELGRGQAEALRHLLAVDRDGWTFVNYLSAVEDIEPSEVLRLLGSHKRHIEENLATYSGCARIHQKYQWAADYHDRFCRYMLARWDELPDMLIGPAHADGELEFFGGDVPRS
jgi:hypothetical protein